MDKSEQWKPQKILKIGNMSHNAYLTLKTAAMCTTNCVTIFVVFHKLCVHDDDDINAKTDKFWLEHDSSCLLSQGIGLHR